MAWKPIKTYDALKRKPHFAIFWFKAVERNGRKDPTLPAIAGLDRFMGRRVCTQWMQFEAPTEGD